MFMKSVHRAAALAAISTAPKDLDINDLASVRNVASTLAYGTMSLYSGNVTNTTDTIAIFPEPYYWWEAGAAWGAMLDYSHYTGDTSYDDVTTEALLSQVGTNFNFMSDLYQGSEGNDDQAFWAFAILAAAERNYPQPDDAIPPWLDIAVNIWNSMVVRWNDTTCGGGLAWQIYASNPNGLSYKNSVANGGFFQISARLARATGNSTYFDWAQKVWNWTEAVGFIDESYNVYDGADSEQDCSVSSRDNKTFSYTPGIFMYGASVMYNYTNGSMIWSDRTAGLLKASKSFFSFSDNSTNIMYEHACEPYGLCNTDMKSFKGYLSRFMWATTKMMPSTLSDVQTLLNQSAKAAAGACSGGGNGTVCGQKWYVGGYDGSAGLGQQISALETVQGLLAVEAPSPFKAGEIKHVRASTTKAIPYTSATPTSSKRSGSSPKAAMDWSIAIVALVIVFVESFC
ncbi:glycoside hydrolase family 76 protein [Xylariaceae sp. FL0016]|nr:glycoside hydrolase family 76 protein [Xylariaceae sp. FL0016]